MRPEGFQTWLSKLCGAVESADPGGVAALFSQDVTYHEAPFLAPRHGRGVVRSLLETEMHQRRDSTAAFDAINFENDIGWASWSLSFTREGTEDPVRLEGVLKAEFGPDGLCMRYRQWWHILEPGQGDLMRDVDA